MKRVPKTCQTRYDIKENSIMSPNFWKKEAKKIVIKGLIMLKIQSPEILAPYIYC